MLPFRIYLEKYTLFKLLGSIRGFDILDLACGNGFYTRELKNNGSAQTIGVDISDEMINIARNIEFDKPLGIVYLEKDVKKLKKIGNFDIVIAAYLLNYAQSEKELKSFCNVILKNLKPGGKFIGVNDNLLQDPSTYEMTKKYGFIKSTSKEIKEGNPIKYTFYKNNKIDFTFSNYCLKPETYKKVFLETGFKSFEWKPFEVSKEGIEKFPEGYWDDFLNCAPLIGIVAQK